nr:MAG TPA: hypothetical protein [Caudoviricetes sp.]
MTSTNTRPGSAVRICLRRMLGSVLRCVKHGTIPMLAHRSRTCTREVNSHVAGNPR